MSRRKELFQDASKITYEGPEPATLVHYFKDDATHALSLTTSPLHGRGVLLNRISEFFFDYLHELGIHSRFMKRLNMREQQVHAAEEFPFALSVRTIMMGDFAKRFGMDDMMPLPKPLIEFTYTEPELHYPLISSEHIVTFGWANPEELDEMDAVAYRINDILSGFFAALSYRIATLHLTFGRLYDEEGDQYHVVLTSEIGPETLEVVPVALLNGEKGEAMPSLSHVYGALAKVLGIVNDVTKGEASHGHGA